MAADYRSVPTDLRKRTQWVAWKYIPKADGKKPIKMPICPATGAEASVSNPATWGTFDVAQRRCQRDRLAGVGYVFTGSDPFFGYDLDDCIDQEGRLAMPSWEIIERFATYAEVSPSGRGVKGFGRGKLLAGGGHSPKDGNVELYDHGRFFCITGRHLKGTPLTLEDCQLYLDEFYRQHFADKLQAPQRKNGQDKAAFTFTEDAAAAIKALGKLSPARCDDYDGWLQVGMALSQLGDVGLDLWEEWSKQSSEYEEGACARKWATFKPGAGTRLGSLIEWAKMDTPQPEPAAAEEATTAEEPPPYTEADVPADELRPTGEWLPPSAFFTADLPPFPTEALPSWVRDEVEALAEATQTPVDLPAMASLAVLAVACQGKVVCNVRPGWTEPVNIYGVTALPSGSRKSNVMSTLAAPIEAHERGEAERLLPDVARGESLYKTSKARLEQLQTQAARAKADEADRLAEEAALAAVEFAGLKVPSLPRLLADDVTPEKMASLLVANGGRMAVLSPEADLFDLMSGRYGNQPNFGVFLKGHSGDNLRVDRIGRAPEFVRNPAITLGLAVQPDVLRGLVATPSLRGRGLLARFLYAWPVSNMGRRTVEPTPVDPAITMTYERAMAALLALPRGLDEDGTPAPHVLKPDTGAYAALMDFATWVEPELAESGQLSTLADWGGKLVGQVVRVAALHHMAMHCYSGEPWVILVEERSARAAIKIGRYLIAHAQAAFAEMGSDPEVEGAQRVLRWTQQADVMTFTKRDAFNGTRGRFKRVEALEPVLSLLVEHGYIREQAPTQTGRPGRKPSPIYDVNPLWRGGT